MNTLIQLIDPTIAQAMGWTIIHSLWQASLIALLMSLIHRFNEHRKSTFKYGVSVLSMIAVLTVSGITFSYYYVTSTTAPELLASVELTQVQIDGMHEKTTLGGLQSFFAQNIEQINLIWGIGVILFLARFFFSYGYTKYLKRSAEFSNSTSLKPILKRIQNNLLIQKTIEIAESAKVNVPMVVGHFKPIILFPIGMVNLLSIDEVEAIITHELAHIKRYDYITNILLTLIEILFYFHPAVWWISANVKSERENCCDDFALSHNIDKMVYAKALVKLEEMKSIRFPSLAMPFSSRKHQLINRIKRIMNMQQTQNDFKEKSIATILLLSIVILFSNQANIESSQSASSQSIAIQVDDKINQNTKLVGKDDLVLKVKDGKLESLTIDNEEQQSEFVEEIASSIERTSDGDESYTVTVKENPLLEVKDDHVHIKGLGGVYYESDDLNPFFGDTIPESSNSSRTIITRENGKTVEVESEDGEITSLKINGEVIPKEKYDQHEEEIEYSRNFYEFDKDNNFFKYFDGNDFSKSFGLLFDGENWREFGGNINQFMDEELMERLKDVEGMRFNFDFKNLDKLEDLNKFHEMERLHKFEGLEHLKELENLNEIFEELGMRMDTTLKGMQFHFDGFDGFEGLDGFRYHFDFDNNDDLNRFYKDFGSDYKSGTVVDKIGRMLNKDGLLNEYKSNKVEITGKHLKINGEKMPKAIFEKYKNVYQETTGAPLTKNSKMVFDVEGKPSKRKVKTF
ncbi:MAG: M56 family metallopeptidase [Bacteroidota bacterium]